MTLVLDEEAQLVVWTDSRNSVGSAWSFDIGSGRLQEIVWDTGAFVSLIHFDASSGQFVTASTLEGPAGSVNFRFALRATRQIDTEIASIRLVGSKIVVTGELSSWTETALVYPFVTRSGDAFSLIVEGESQPRLERLSWFGALFEPLYQSELSALLIVDSNEIVFAVQRSNTLIVCDATSLQIKTKVPLPGHYNGAHLVGTKARGQLIATNYDTIALIDSDKWTVLNARQMQQELGVTGAYIGHPTLTASADLLVVPRPFSRDVLTVNSTTFNTTSRTRFDGEPMEAARSEDGLVVALLRDKPSIALKNGSAARHPSDSGS